MFMSFEYFRNLISDNQYKFDDTIAFFLSTAGQMATLVMSGGKGFVRDG